MDSHSNNTLTPEAETPREDTFMDNVFSETPKTEQHYNSQEEFLTDLPRRLRAIADGAVKPTEDNLLKVNADARKLNIPHEAFREHCGKFIENYKGGFIDKINSMTSAYEQSEKNAAENLPSREETIEAVQTRKEAALDNFRELRSDEEHYRSVGDNKLLPVLNFLRENKLEKLNKAIAANTRRINKTAKLENKIRNLRTRSERLTMANAALTGFFNGSPPKPIRDIIKANERKIERINERKIPDRYKKIEDITKKVERGSKKIELLRSETNKLENLSALIKSFATLDTEKRRAEFTTALDGMHNAARRSLELRIEKFENKIEGYNAKLADNTHKPLIPEKIFKAQRNIAKLTAKLEKLNAVKLPFAMQKPETVDKVMDTAQKEVERYNKSLEDTETAEQLESVSDFSDNLCEKCGEVLTEQEILLSQPERESMADLMSQIDKNTAVSSAGKEQMKAPAEKSQEKEAVAPEEKSDKAIQIIGNTNYGDIQNKYYVNLTPERAREVSAILTENGIAHSGKIYNETEAKITLDKSDVKAYRQLTSVKREQTRESSGKEQSAKSNERNSRPQKRKHEHEL